jgi:calcium-dependent protein kinase
MGNVCHSKKQKNYEEKNGESPPNGSKNHKEAKRKTIKNVEEYEVGTSNFVSEKNNSIRDDYYFDVVPKGEGGFGKVYFAKHKTMNVSRAIKVISKSKLSEAEHKKLVEEIKILKDLDHPNIIKVFEFYQDSKALYIVMGVCKGGELLDRIQNLGSFDEMSAARITHQLLSALTYIHAKNIVHRYVFSNN